VNSKEELSVDVLSGIGSKKYRRKLRTLKEEKLLVIFVFLFFFSIFFKKKSKFHIFVTILFFLL